MASGDNKSRKRIKICDSDDENDRNDDDDDDEDGMIF